MCDKPYRREKQKKADAGDQQLKRQAAEAEAFAHDKKKRFVPKGRKDFRKMHGSCHLINVTVGKIIKADGVPE